ERICTGAWAHYTKSLGQHGSPVKRGLNEWFDFLDAHWIPRAVATATHTDLARRQLDQVGVFARLQALIGGEQVASGKPAPDIFLLAAATLGCEPAHTFVIEDSQPGIQAGA